MESFCPLASISALPSEHFLLPSTIPWWSDATVAAQAPMTLTGRCSRRQLLAGRVWRALQGRAEGIQKLYVTTC
jgi:hypothetical protein